MFPRARFQELTEDERLTQKTFERLPGRRRDRPGRPGQPGRHRARVRLRAREPRAGRRDDAAAVADRLPAAASTGTSRAAAPRARSCAARPGRLVRGVRLRATDGVVDGRLARRSSSSTSARPSPTRRSAVTEPSRRRSPTLAAASARRRRAPRSSKPTRSGCDVAAPVYRFLPWARRGLAAGRARRRATDNPAAAPPPARSTLPGRRRRQRRPAATRVRPLRPGRGDRASTAASILRTDPRPGATDFEPNYLATIEFDPPDFPWLFTPAAPPAASCGRGACSIVVEKAPRRHDRAAARTRRCRCSRSPTPAVASRELPDLAESWAWAHTQILEEAGQPGHACTSTSTSTPTATSAASSARGGSGPRRATSPRRAGVRPRRRSAGSASRDRRATQAKPAWDARAPPRRQRISLPLYYFWEFSTAVEDDIESMARRLHGPEHAPPDLGRRRIYAAAGHADLAAAAPRPPTARDRDDGRRAAAGATANATPPPVRRRR